MKKNSPVAKAKYVVETACTNGNVFLHGPFNSRSAAEAFVEDATAQASRNDFANPSLAPQSHNKVKIRAILHPTKWTKAAA